MLRPMLTFLLVAELAAATGCFAQNARVNYRGRLVRRDGHALTGDQAVTFRIYNDPVLATHLWEEFHPAVPVVNGEFAVTLGAASALDVLGFDEPYYLGIQVGGDAEMTPRLPFTAARYSLAAMWGTTGPAGPAGVGTGVAEGFEVGGSLGCGAATTANQLYGFATVLMRDETPRIVFDDTSNSGSFPANDWELRANDAGPGGQSYFAVVDLGTGVAVGKTGTRVFTVMAGAPAGSLFIDGTGNVGVGTLAPAADLHVVRTTRAALRLDARGGSTTAVAEMGALSGSPFVGSVTAQPLQFETGGVPRMTLTVGGAIQMADGGSYTGTWNAASSRAIKTGVVPLSSADAAAVVDGLEPVRFRYTARPDDEHLGFIAEDVPELVATPERKSLCEMDIVAALTRVVQDQQAAIDGNGRLLEQLEARLSALEAAR